MNNAFQMRLAKLHERIRSNGLEGVILTAGPNIRYYTGVNSLLLERLFLLFIPRERNLHLVAPKFELGPYIRTSLPITTHAWADDEGPSYALQAVVRELGLRGKWGVEGRVPYRFIHLLVAHSRPELEDAEPILQTVREVKEPREVQMIKRAASILSSAFLRIPDLIHPGMREVELAKKITQLIYSNGAELVDDVLVQSGASAADPHHLPESKKIQRRQSVVVDATCTYSGYYADVTRTYIMGRNSVLENVYENVYEAQREAIGASKPGSTTGHIDEAARIRLKEQGLDKYFIHRTGHGLGLEVHEAPYIVPNGPEVVQQFTVFTIEPGVYFPGKFGVRIEDDVKVAQNGANVLTRSLPRELGWWHR